MKKFVSVILALVLCMSACAMAASVPSKNTGDMTTVSVASDNIPADSGFAFVPVTEESGEEYASNYEACTKEIEKMKNSASIEEYFGEVVDKDGNVISLTDILGVDVLNVYEMMPVIVENYDVSYGDVTFDFQFKTPYSEGEKVLVLIGIEDAITGAIAWTAFEGVGTGENGAIEVTFNADTMEAIQNNMAFMAVVSK